MTQEFPLTPAVLVRAHELFQGFVLSLAPCGTAMQTGKFPPRGSSLLSDTGKGFSDRFSLRPVPRKAADRAIPLPNFSTPSCTT